MEVIQIEDILRIYNACGLNGNKQSPVRFTINTGRLDNSLNMGSTNRPTFNNATEHTVQSTMTYNRGK